MEVDEPPRHQKQNAGHGRIGKIRGKGRHQQQYEQQKNRREHRSERRARTGCVIDAAAIEGAAGGIAGEQTP